MYEPRKNGASFSVELNRFAFTTGDSFSLLPVVGVEEATGRFLKPALGCSSVVGVEEATSRFLKPALRCSSVVGVDEVTGLFLAIGVELSSGSRSTICLILNPVVAEKVDGRFLAFVVTCSSRFDIPMALGRCLIINPVAGDRETTCWTIRV